MWVLLGIILGLVYVVQPIDMLHAPVEFLNSSLITYTGAGMDWLTGFFPDSEAGRFMSLVVAVGTPGIAGLILNLIAPLSRVFRVIFSILITLVSFGAFGALPWQEALLFSLSTTVVGAVLAIASGPIMEAAAAFFSVTLGVSQVRMLLFDTPSAKLSEMINYMAGQLPFMEADGLRVVCACFALIPTALVVAWLCWRLTPTRGTVLV